MYHEDVSGRCIVIDNPFENKVLVIPYLTRFDAQYREKLVKRMSVLKDLKYVKGGVFLNLTCDPKRFHSQKEEYEAMQKGFNRLLARYRKKLGRLLYVISKEFTDEGHLHFHVVFLGIKRLEDQHRISELWEKYGIGKVVDVRRIWENTNIYNYVMKYVSKGLGNKGSSSLHFESKDRFTDGLVLSWALGIRMLDFSRDLIDFVVHLIREIRLIQTQKCHHNTKDSPNIPNHVNQIGDLGGGGIISPPNMEEKSPWEYLGAFRYLPPGLYQGGNRYNILMSLQK